MKILITGANGQLGHYLRELAPEKLAPGAELIACDRSQLNLARAESIHQAIEGHRPQVVINAGAYTAVDKAESEPELAKRINGEAVADLAAACQGMSARLIHISTDYVFDGTKRSPYLTTDTPKPINVYGSSKLLGEQNMPSSTGNACTVRTSWVYSEQGHNFANTMRRLFKEHETLRVVDDQVSRPTHARDLAAFCLRLAQDPAAWLDLLHFAGPEVMSWHQLACRLLEQAGDDIVTQSIQPIPTEQYPTPAKRPLYTALALSDYHVEPAGK